MADEKKAKDGAKQEAKAENKVIAWFKALPKRIATPFKNMVNELKRVTWPSKQKLIRYSIIVLVFVLVMMLIIGLFDFGSARLVNALHVQKAAETTEAAAETEVTEEAAETAEGMENTENTEPTETTENPESTEATENTESAETAESAEAAGTTENTETETQASVEPESQETSAPITTDNE